MENVYARAVGAKIPITTVNEIEEIVNSGCYLNVSDFVREAVREKLEHYKVIKVRDVSHKEAKKEVLGYFKSIKEAYPHQIAEDLELDYELVCDITDELKKEGRIGVAE